MKIALLGDIALFGSNTAASGTYKSRMIPVKEVLDGCDYVVANLETPLTNATKTIGGKSAYIKGKPEDIEILEWLGVTHVSLANNHMFDYRIEGFEDTIEVLERHGVCWYGANGRVETIEDGDRKVALHGYCCYSTNGKRIGGKLPSVDVLDPQKVEADLYADEDDDVYPILSIHWGQEHVHYPNYDHILAAHRLTKDHHLTIHGHHPHVLQGVENRDGSLIAYSLGNFCFDDVYTSKSDKPLIQLSKENKESCVIELNIEDGKLIDWNIVPFHFYDGIYYLDEKVRHKMDEYSKLLEENEETFRAERFEELEHYLESRRKLRDVNWYMKRLNLESMRIILSDLRNAKAYKRTILQYINTETP